MIEAPPARGELIRDHVIGRLPVVFLWPFAGCNCRCMMCDIWKDTSRKEIPLETVRGWLPEWKALGVRHVALTGGEARMHSGVWELCDIVREAGIKILLLTAGVGLAPHARKVIAHCDSLIVSLDGPPDVHNRIRGIPNAFGKLEAAVKAIKTAAPSFPISGRSTVNRINAGLIDKTALAARAIGIDRMSFLATDLFSDAFAREKGAAVEGADILDVDLQALGELEAALGRLEREHAGLFDSGFLAETPRELRTLLIDHYRAMLGVGAFLRRECNAPWATAVIGPDGTVSPCFFQPAYGRIDAGTSLADVVNSPNAVSWRNGLDMASDAICQRCVCTFRVRSCGCGMSRDGEYCDNTCRWIALLDPVASSNDPKPAEPRS
ncbi:radical SAM protein [uncultured Methylobacterium sp.]|jgi:MoaA/NifB/PqqE/SkfB family radical SAM enzyme|uniref:radical SAM protein n=1 Tax=uncultured Methylobacterium sp. TaxID=157278 RepID=UPI002624FF9D|nr:radical SAM protein [uncultured Methylobacterium sp.]